MSETLREALDWCLDYIEGTDARNLTMPPLAEPFFSEQMARYRALVDETPKDDRASALLAPFAAMGGDWAMPAYHDLEADIVVWGPSAGRCVTAGDVRAARRYLNGATEDEPDYRAALATPPVPAGLPHPGHPAGQWACAETCGVPVPAGQAEVTPSAEDANSKSPRIWRAAARDLHERGDDEDVPDERERLAALLHEEFTKAGFWSCIHSPENEWAPWCVDLADRLHAAGVRLTEGGNK